MTHATPRPWIRESGSRTVNETTTVSIRDANGTLVAKAHSPNSAREAIERANTIVQAVNTLDEAKAVLKFIKKELQESRGNVTGLWARVKMIDARIEAVLAKLEGRV